MEYHFIKRFINHDPLCTLFIGILTVTWKESEQVPPAASAVSVVTPSNVNVSKSSLRVQTSESQIWNSFYTLHAYTSLQYNLLSTLILCSLKMWYLNRHLDKTGSEYKCSFR